MNIKIETYEPQPIGDLLILCDTLKFDESKKISLSLLLCLSLLSEISFSLLNIFDAILGPLIDGMLALAA